MPDDSLESRARTYRRGLEDVRDGLATRAQPDLSVRQTEANLRQIEREQYIRGCLRHSWGAADRTDRAATDDRLEFDAAGGLAMMAEAFRAGQEPMLRPSYKLAQFLDLERWRMRRFSTFRMLDPGDPHRPFWAWETVDGPVFWIYYLGLFSICWSEVDGWHWGGWNLD